MRSAALGVSGLMLTSFAYVASAQVPFAANDSMVAFWPMTTYDGGEYASGTTFADPDCGLGEKQHMANLLSETIRPGIAYDRRQIRFRTYGDGSIVLTNDVPGAYLFASAKARMPMTDGYLSFFCKNYTSAHAGNGQPGAWINNWQSEVQSRSEWTFEFFFKNVNASGEMLYFTMSTSQKRIYLKVADHRVSLWANTDTHTYADNTAVVDVGTGIDLATDGQWHHVALTYRQPDESVDGDMQLYVDYRQAPSTIKACRDKNAGGAEFRLRAGIGEGFISAVRFSDKVLSADELMRASNSASQSQHPKVGFWSMDDQPVGWSYSANSTSYSTIANYSNRVNGTDYNCNNKLVTLMVKSMAAGAEALGFQSVNDIPGKYIYESLSATAPLWEPKASLFMAGANANFAESEAGATVLDVSGPTMDMSALSEWTYEFFLKHDKKPPAAVFMYAKLGSVDNDGALSQVQLGQGNADNKLWFYTTDGGSENVLYPDGYSYADGKWHHYALVYKDGKVRLFADYVLSSESRILVQGTSKKTNELRIGPSGAFRGKISCMRMTAKALDSVDFMYASDGDRGVLGESGWMWSLDGRKGEDIAQLEASLTTLKDPDQYFFSHAEEGLAGEVSGEGTACYVEPIFRGHRIFGSEDRGRNGAAGHFVSKHMAAGLNSPLCLLGRAFTVELCVTPQLPSSGWATVVGGSDSKDAFGWRLVVNQLGTLRLEVKMENGEVVARDVPDAMVTGTPCQIALSADLLMRAFEVYVSREAQISLAASDFPLPVADGPKLSVGGGCEGEGLSGVFDEVHVVRKTLSAEELETFKRQGFILIAR